MAAPPPRRVVITGIGVLSPIGHDTAAFWQSLLARKRGVRTIRAAQGPNNSITATDVASLLAVGEAYRILKRDQADFFLAGAADSKRTPLSLVRQCLFTPLSKRNDDPAGACRPFDRGRDGEVI